MSKPIEIMHYYFATSKDNHCETCCNLIEMNIGKKTVRKCRAYGITCSNKSDWAKKWQACGLYEKEVNHQVISDTAKRMFSRIGIRYEPPTNIDGQMKLDGGEING